MSEERDAPRFWLTLLIGAALLGASAGCGVTVLGTVLGLLIEGILGSPVAGWEFVPVGVAKKATLGGVIVALLGALSGRWWRGFAIGAIAHGLVFGWVVLQGGPPGAPFTVSIWIFVVGLLAGGTAGALGRVVAQRRGQVPP